MRFTTVTPLRERSQRRAHAARVAQALSVLMLKAMKSSSRGSHKRLRAWCMMNVACPKPLISCTICS